VRADPGSFRFRELLGTAYDSLAVWHEARSQPAEALQQALRSQEVFSRLAARDPANQLWSWKLELSRMKEGYLHLLQDEPRQALPILAPLAGRAAQRMEREPDDRRWRLLAAWTHVDLGTALAAQGRNAEARKSALWATEQLAALHEREPDDRDIDRGLAKALILLGQMERRRGEEAAARRAWERARSFLAPAARRSGSVKLLEPWAAALLLLQRKAEALPILTKLQGCGYLPSDLMILCRQAGIEIPIRRET
jgi:hypothetical protein